MAVVIGIVRTVGSGHLPLPLPGLSARARSLQRGFFHPAVAVNDRVLDFFRVGGVLQVLLWIVILAFTPHVWPLYPSLAPIMLYFYPAPKSLDVDAVRRQGLRRKGGEDIVLHTSLSTARERASGPVLVIDPSELDSPPVQRDEAISVSSIPASAIQNHSPYRPPSEVIAAGGYVTCSVPDDVALLLIRKRGVWDLPKGKLDPGESIQTCAVREVQEEVGIQKLEAILSLGTTQHGYPDGETYAVKTNHWFLMQTPERSFAPDRTEGIRRVARARWDVAYQHLGYDNLRRHMDEIESVVRSHITQ